jgi:hypothetical protein
MKLFPANFCQRRFILLIAAAISATQNSICVAFSQNPSSSSGDRVRLASGIRPSLHPLTINVISEVLRKRSLDYFSTTKDKRDPIQIELLSIDEIIADALDKRNRACRADSSISSDTFNREECEAIKTRVVGVVSTLERLENALVSKVSGIPWVAKYGEYGAFGVVSDECCDPNNSSRNQNDTMKALLEDPLLRMTRAECLLALFLTEITLGMTGDETIDFLDSERRDVLL